MAHIKAHTAGIDMRYLNIYGGGDNGAAMALERNGVFFSCFVSTFEYFLTV